MAIRKTNCNGWCIDTHDHDHVVRPARKPLKRLAGSTIVVGIKSNDRELHKHCPSKPFGNDANVFDVAEAQALATHNIAATTATLPDTQWKLFCCCRAATPHKCVKQLRQDQEMIVCVGGVTTVKNVSGDAVHPGSLLYGHTEGAKYNTIWRTRTEKEREKHRHAIALSHAKHGQRMDIFVHPLETVETLQHHSIHAELHCCV